MCRLATYAGGRARNSRLENPVEGVVVPPVCDRNSRLENTGGLIVSASRSSSVETLLPGVESGSNWSLALTCAVFVLVPVLATVAVICSVALAPLLIEPTVQMPTLLL